MRLFFAYCKQIRTTLILCTCFAAVFLVSFALYGLPLAAVLYPIALCFFGGVAVLIVDFVRVKRLHAALVRLAGLDAETLGALPRAGTIPERDYAAIIEMLLSEFERDHAAGEAAYRDAADYFTLWAHQIKTPIAAMRLMLASEDTPSARRLTSEVNRVELYVDMVLTYMRLMDGGSDYVIRETALDPLIRASVRRFSSEFVARRLTLGYTPVDKVILTDEKWFVFILEQLLSNALKYTRTGGIAIALENDDTLLISDTGIGIAPEDLPRIFEKGYTGYNGRTDRRASGIGLFLVKRIAERLNITVSASSTVGKGTTIRLGLVRAGMRHE